MLARLESALGGRYRVERELGRGGMATVYLAEDLKHHRQVALKILRPELMSAIAAQRFSREIEIAAHLSHPNILPLYDSGDEEGMRYYVMPYVVGGSLRDRLKDGALPVSEGVRIMSAVADALAYAHAAGLIHRDIKPENILFQADHPVVTDFGIARTILAPAGSALTDTGLAVGTPSYMSPEQATGSEVDEGTDIYSLGAVAYEMLCGSPPFARPTAQQTIAAHVTEFARPIAELRAAVPVALADLVMLCLAKAPDERPQSAVAVLQVLATLGNQHGTQPEPGLRGRRDGARLQGIRASFRSGIRPRVSWRAAGISAVLTLPLLAASVDAIGLVRAVGKSPSTRLSASETLWRGEPLLLADFDVQGSADSIGPALTSAVRTALGQSSAITLMSAAATVDALRRMRRPEDQKVDIGVAREIAARDGVRAIVHGEVVGLGGRFAVTLRVVEPSSGAPLTTITKTANSARELIPTIDALSRRLRASAGEHVDSIRASPPLAYVTTSSLAALHKYTAGIRAIYIEVDPEKAVGLLEEAVALDSGFAMAWRALAVASSNAQRDPAVADSALAAAFRHRERLPEAERDHVTAYYYWEGPHRDRAKAATAYAALVERGFFVPAALNNLGLIHAERREFARAASLFRRSIELNPRNALAMSNLIDVLLDDGKIAAAESTIAAARARFPDNTAPAVQSALLWYVRGDLPSYRRSLDSLRSSPRPQLRRFGVIASGHFALLTGQLRRFEELREQAWAAGMIPTSQETPQGPGPASRDSSHAVRPNAGLSVVGAGESERLSWSVRDPAELILRAFVDARFRGEHQRSLRRLNAAVALHNDGHAWDLGTLELLIRTYAELGAASEARSVLERHLRSVTDTATLRWQRPAYRNMQGHIARAERRYADAVAAYRAADMLPDGPSNRCGVCLPLNLAATYDAARLADSAIANYERFVHGHYLGRVAELDPLHLAHVYRRLAALHEAGGRQQRAAEYHERLIQLWDGADAVLQPQVRHARRRLDALRQGARQVEP